MAGDPEQVVKFEKLRRSFQDAELIEPQKLLAHIEASGKHLYVYPLKIAEKDYGLIRFRRWTHEEADRFAHLSYLPKLLEGKELTEAEAQEFLVFQAEMLVDVLDDRKRWEETIRNDESFVYSMFELVRYVSGLHELFDKDLEQFVASDYGFSYGLIWFSLMKKTPSEVAQLPETDVKTVNAWFARWMEKVKSDGN